jgi:coproporphyrinogen III oxidase
MSLQEAIHDFMQSLQGSILEGLRHMDAGARVTRDQWQRPGGGGGCSVVLSGGELLEKAGVNYSRVSGSTLPEAATRKRPHLAGLPFIATGVSVVLHPENPHVPAAHLNVRYFSTRDSRDQPAAWWFGGGFDLTPVYPFHQDAIAWHRAAREACAPWGAGLYPRFKEACDRYFHLPHRQETRGIGGLFFDDFNELGPDNSFALTRSVGSAFLPAWQSIAERRRQLPFTPQQKAFQRYRRGRYAEFNLLYDRGTLFGLQSGGRTESILMSLPPQVDWVYNYQPEPGSPENTLADFLRPRDWLEEA